MRGREASHRAAREVHGVPIAKSNLVPVGNPYKEHQGTMDLWSMEDFYGIVYTSNSKNGMTRI